MITELMLFTADEFFAATRGDMLDVRWLRRGREYRERAEQLDIVNWYRSRCLF